MAIDFAAAVFFALIAGTLLIFTWPRTGASTTQAASEPKAPRT